jgi:pimeloyl-ACP methyl ester carboxylesterase
MDVAGYDAHRETAHTSAGDVAYAEFGDPSAPAAVFVHGVFMSGLLWRNAMELVQGERRCIAVDLPAHGRTRVDAGRPFTVEAHAQFLESFCDALGLDRLDLVGNDTGGAVSQVFAVRNPDRLRTLTLTNCDTPGNFPPQAFEPTVELARRGEFAAVVGAMLDDLGFARQALATAYERPDDVPDDVLRSFFEPFRTEEGRRELERFMTEPRGEELLEIEPRLKELDVPALLVWATADVFFDLTWAHRLRDTLPRVAELAEVPGAKLFFVDERADELVPHLIRHWKEHSP